MSDSTATARLARMLEILPRAASEEGVEIVALAESMGEEKSAILRDIQELCTRAFYQPAGAGDEIQVTIDMDRVSVWTTAEFRRPVRLDVRETLALGLGLRMLMAESPDPARQELMRLAERLEGELAARGADALLSHVATTPADSDTTVQSVVARAARDQRRCKIRYLKDGAQDPEPRSIEPYAIALAEGRAYVIARCLRADDERVFRLDRIIEAVDTGETFERPEDFDLSEWTIGGRVFRAEDAPEVVVRYSVRIAPWLREQGPVEEQDDGSVIVRYTLADPEWAIAHVLRHGPDAELVSPVELRADVAEAAERADR